MPDTWLDGYQRMPLGGDVAGMEYAEYDDPKLLWHMTQGSSVTGAINAYRPYPPHLIVNARTDERIQHIPLNRAAYSLAGTANDRSRVIQVEVVGFSEYAHLMSNAELRWLGENVVRPVRAAFGVPDQYLRCWAAYEVDFVLASPDSPIRLSLGGLRGYSGHMGHQHAPAPDEHWDPGGLDLEHIIQYSHDEVTPTRRRKSKMNGIGLEVTHDAVTNIAVGAAFIIDFSNSRSTYVSDKDSLRTAFKDAGVPHMGVSGAEAAEWISKYNAGPAIPPTA
jgi:hypothetical protein